MIKFAIWTWTKTRLHKRIAAPKKGGWKKSKYRISLGRTNSPVTTHLRMSLISSSIRETGWFMRDCVLITWPSFDCFIPRWRGRADALLTSKLKYGYRQLWMVIPRLTAVWKHAQSSRLITARTRREFPAGWICNGATCVSRLIKITNIWEDRMRMCQAYFPTWLMRQLIHELSSSSARRTKDLKYWGLPASFIRAQKPAGAATQRNFSHNSWVI